MRSSSWLYLCPTRMNRCLEDEVVRLKSGRRPRHRSTRRSQRQHAHRRSQQYSGEAAGSPPAPYRIEHCQCSRVSASKQRPHAESAQRDDRCATKMLSTHLSRRHTVATWHLRESHDYLFYFHIEHDTPRHGPMERLGMIYCMELLSDIEQHCPIK